MTTILLTISPLSNVILDQKSVLQKEKWIKATVLSKVGIDEAIQAKVVLIQWRAAPRLRH